MSFGFKICNKSFDVSKGEVFLIGAASPSSSRNYAWNCNVAFHEMLDPAVAKEYKFELTFFLLAAAARLSEEAFKGSNTKHILRNTFENLGTFAITHLHIKEMFICRFQNEFKADSEQICITIWAKQADIRQVIIWMIYSSSALLS